MPKYFLKFFSFQSTLPAWGETGNMAVALDMAKISIHSPRMGERPAHGTRPARPANFNPLSPHGERHDPRPETCRAGEISIHSPRMGRDHIIKALIQYFQEISIHSPRMGRDNAASTFPCVLLISIHSPAAGRDATLSRCRAGADGISIHSPRMGRTKAPARMPAGLDISIHSPRMGETPFHVQSSFSVDFNPLSPHGRDS